MTYYLVREGEWLAMIDAAALCGVVGKTTTTTTTMMTEMETSTEHAGG